MHTVQPLLPAILEHFYNPISSSLSNLRSICVDLPSLFSMSAVFFVIDRIADAKNLKEGFIPGPSSGSTAHHAQERWQCEQPSCGIRSINWKAWVKSGGGL